MAQNIQPIFVLTPNISWAQLDTAPPSGSHQGSGSLGTDIQTVFTSGASGSRVNEIRVVSLGLNPTSIVRLYINNGSDNNVLTNNTLFDEVEIAATSKSEINGAPINSTLYSDGIIIPATYRLIANVSVDQTDGLHVTAFGGDY
jgi:hypothetical protein